MVTAMMEKYHFSNLSSALVKRYTVSKNEAIPKLLWNFQIHRVYKILVVLTLTSQLQNKQSEAKNGIWNKNLLKIRQARAQNLV